MWPGNPKRYRTNTRKALPRNSTRSVKCSAGGRRISSPAKRKTALCKEGGKEKSFGYGRRTCCRHSTTSRASRCSASENVCGAIKATAVPGAHKGCRGIVLYQHLRSGIAERRIPSFFFFEASYRPLQRKLIAVSALDMHVPERFRKTVAVRYHQTTLTILKFLKAPKHQRTQVSKEYKRIRDPKRSCGYGRRTGCRQATTSRAPRGARRGTAGRRPRPG